MPQPTETLGTRTVESLLPVLEEAKTIFTDCDVQLADFVDGYPFIALGVRNNNLPLGYRYECIASSISIEGLKWQRNLVCLLSEKQAEEKQAEERRQSDENKRD